MKKLLLTVAAICLLSAEVEAQYYGGYSQAQSYGDSGYMQSYGDGSYATQQSYGNASYAGQQNYGSGSYTQNQSPVYRPQAQQGASAKKRGATRNGSKTGQRKNQKLKQFYVAPRLGFGTTRGWKGNVDNAKSPVFEVAAGMSLKEFRVEGEIGYHMEDEIYSKGHASVKYSQWDFGVNGFYDHNMGRLKPFVGGGVGLSKLKATAKGYGHSTSDSKTSFTFALMAGASYDVTDMMVAELMARYRYLFRKNDLYNLDLLAGLRFKF